GGKYLSVNLRREELYRYGLSADDVNMVIESALGGVTASTAIEGRKRFPITVRMSEDFRGSIDAIGRIPLMSPEYGNIPLSAVADIVLEDGPPMISSENAILRGAVMFNVRGRDLGNTVEEAMKVIKEEKGIMPQGYFIEWSGQYENLIRGRNTLMLIAPVVLIIIFLSLYFAFKSVREAFLSLITIPFALIGGAFL